MFSCLFVLVRTECEYEKEKELFFLSSRFVVSV